MKNSVNTVQLLRPYHEFFADFRRFFRTPLSNNQSSTFDLILIYKMQKNVRKFEFRGHGLRIHLNKHRKSKPRHAAQQLIAQPLRQPCHPKHLPCLLVLASLHHRASPHDFQFFRFRVKANLLVINIPF